MSSGTKPYPPEQTELLIETLKWWVLMLATVVRRMGAYLDRQMTTKKILDHECDRPIRDYFSQAT